MGSDIVILGESGSLLHSLLPSLAHFPLQLGVASLFYQEAKFKQTRIPTKTNFVVEAFSSLGRGLSVLLPIQTPLQTSLSLYSHSDPQSF